MQVWVVNGQGPKDHRAGLSVKQMLGRETCCGEGDTRQAQEYLSRGSLEGLFVGLSGLG